MGSAALADLPGRGWFEAPGITGDRTLSQQMRGLEAVVAEARGATVLDLACAEGLIGLELMAAGAVLLDGVELVVGRVEQARINARPYGHLCRFWQLDLETFAERPPIVLAQRYDIVLALAIAHKLRQPAEFLRAAARRCGDLLAVRLPAPVIRDKRSGLEPLDVRGLFARNGFAMEVEAEGSHAEWIGLFRRCA